MSVELAPPFALTPSACLRRTSTGRSSGALHPPLDHRSGVGALRSDRLGEHWVTAVGWHLDAVVAIAAKAFRRCVQLEISRVRFAALANRNDVTVADGAVRPGLRVT